jgi:hypothetical protein
MTTTKGATLWLAGIRTALVPESYQQLTTILESVIQEHETEELTEAHVALALRRMEAGQSSKITQQHGGTR